MSAHLSRMLGNCVAPTMLLATLLGVAQSQALHVTDLQGHEIKQLVPNESRALVLIFAATDCPISNRYIPYIESLSRELTARKVEFQWVFPNPGDSLPVVRKHGADYSIAAPTLIDSQQDLVHMAHVSVTPEAAVFAVNAGRLQEVYHGPIDDRYIALGKERPQAVHQDLKQAIEAVLTGRPVLKPASAPVGCSIVPVSKP